MATTPAMPSQPPPPPPGFVPMNQDTSQAGNAPPPPPGFVPMNASGSPAQPAETPRTETLTLQSHAMGKTPVTYTVPSDLTSNPPDPKTGQGEGTYKFWNAHGMPIMVPYSKALALLGHPEGALGSGQSEVDRFHQAYSDLKSQGFTLDDADVPRLYSDYAGDPRLKDVRAQNFYKSIPSIGYPRGAARTVAGGIHATGHQAPHALDVLANTPNNPDPAIGAMQTGSEVAENVNEFTAGEGLMGAVGKVLGPGVKLAEAAKIEQEVQKGSPIGRLALIALKQGTVAGAQTYAKSGGDAGAAATAAAGTALASGALSSVSEGGGNLLRKFTPEGQATAKAASPGVKGAAEYGDKMGEIIKPHLEAVNAASGEGETVVPGRTVQHETGLLDERGKPLMREESIPGKTVPPIEKIDVAEAMARTGDANRARQELKDGLNTVQAQMDGETKGAYSKLRDEVSRAEEKASSGMPDDEGAFIEKQNELDDLIQQSGAKPEIKNALSDGWRQYYQLGRAQRLLDGSLEGLPGDTKTSYVNRGINGKKLLSGLKTWIADPKVGRTGVAQALGGEDRLKALEEIGNKTSTNTGRAGVNQVARFVAKSLAGAVGAKVGYASAGWVGGSVGAKIGWEAPTVAAGATSRVFKAMMANPNIARNLIFAADSGAKPENYGPLIATMIQKWETDASREQQAEEAQ